jgi:[ribosomal protein S5]-alanine N-acetyltransferase
MAFGPVLRGEVVLLREPEPSDVDARQSLGTHADIQRGFGASHPRTGPMTRAAAEAWVTGLGGEGSIEWVVEAEGSFLGNARLHSFEGREARYAVGFYDHARLGRGYGTGVTTLVLGYAFGELGLLRVTLAVLEDNERAIRCYRRCGFRLLSRVPEAAIVDGEHLDDLVMAVGADEFRTST